MGHINADFNKRGLFSDGPVATIGTTIKNEWRGIEYSFLMFTRRRKGEALLRQMGNRRAKTPPLSEDDRVALNYVGLIPSDEWLFFSDKYKKKILDLLGPALPALHRLAPDVCHHILDQSRSHQITNPQLQDFFEQYRFVINGIQPERQIKKSALMNGLANGPSNGPDHPFAL